MPAHPDPTRIRGWLLLLCLLLLVWQPVESALVLSSLLSAIGERGAGLALILVVRLIVAALGIAAGIAILTRQDRAVWMARAALTATVAVDLLVYGTPYVPNNRMPGDTPIYVAAALAYYVVWMAYLWRSARVRLTFPRE